MLGVREFLYIFEGYESVHMGCLGLRMTDRAGKAFAGWSRAFGVHRFFRILGQFSYIFMGKSMPGYYLFGFFE
jgi:hypothetical protein